MVWLHETDWHPSLAVQVLVTVWPVGQTPTTESVNETIGAGLQLSVAIGLPAVPGSVGDPQVVVKSSGQVIIGGVLSLTEIIWEQTPTFPQASTP